jgi:hypothetical protein
VSRACTTTNWCLLICSGLLAYLDNDEDGLIALATLKALLRREDVFDAIPEHQVRIYLLLRLYL